VNDLEGGCSVLFQDIDPDISFWIMNKPEEMLKKAGALAEIVRHASLAILPKKECRHFYLNCR
jgi:hypothetical protein